MAHKVKQGNGFILRRVALIYVTFTDDKLIDRSTALHLSIRILAEFQLDFFHFPDNAHCSSEPEQQIDQ